MTPKRWKAQRVAAGVSDNATLDEPALDANSKPTSADARAGNTPGTLDVRAQSALLRQAFEATEFGVASPDSVLSPAHRAFISRWGWRVAKLAAGVAILAIAAVGPIQRLLEISSVDAVVNARLVSLRSPIDGMVETTPDFPAIGTQTPAGISVLRISNSRADRSRLDDLSRLIDQIEGERSAVQGRLARLKQLYEQVLQQTNAFQNGRVKELEERAMDLRAQAAGAQAARVEADSTLERMKVLANSGVQAQVTLERAQRDAVIASEAERALSHRLFAVKIELEAARRGEYVGDTYNDRPSSRQQADELSVRIAEGEAELSSRDQRLEKLRIQLVAEQARYANTSQALLSAPIDARVWEVLVSPGEEVRRGQDLLRLLDCSGAVVTTTVREAVFNNLHLGDNAEFRFAGGSSSYNGHVIRMSGVASPPDNLAIQTSSPSSGPYRITVAVPDLALPHCAIGRTGRVVFHPADASGGITGSIRDFIPGL
jgi:multidrug resistance efflux pump